MKTTSPSRRFGRIIPAKVSFHILLTAVLGAPSFANEVDSIDVDPVSAPVWAAAALPPLDHGTTDWTTAALIYNHSRGGRSWHAWAGVSPEALHIRAEVTDPEHNASFRERHLWRGDAIFIGVDGLGDSSGNELSGPLPIDDLSLIVGLGSDGPDAYIDRRGIPAWMRPPPKEWCVLSTVTN